MDINAISYFVGAICVILAAWNCSALLRTNSSKRHPGGDDSRFGGSNREAATRVIQFQKRLRSILEQVVSVEEHSGEYFTVLNENGWARIVAILDPLEKASRTLDTCIEKGEFRVAEQIVSWMETCAAGAPIPTALAYLPANDVEALRPWDREIDETIVKVVDALHEAAHRTKELGIERKHKRKPTLLSVDTLLKRMNQKEEKSLSVKDWE